MEACIEAGRHLGKMAVAGYICLWVLEASGPEIRESLDSHGLERGTLIGTGIVYMNSA